MKYKVTVSIQATVNVEIDASSAEDAIRIAEGMDYDQFENREYEVHGICDIDTCDVTLVGEQHEISA